jgi:hypothetical protein
MASIEWLGISQYSKLIGAVGIIDRHACIVVSFYEDQDGNQDGTVNAGEWLASKLAPISIEGHATLQVAMAAKYNLRLLEKDADFARWADQQFLKFASGLVIDGIYAAYFSRGVSLIGGGMAKMITSGMVKEFIVKKGFETVVKEAFQAAVGR